LIFIFIKSLLLSLKPINSTMGQQSMLTALGEQLMTPQKFGEC